ncbi:MAG: flagellar brake protein [Rhodocyclaceae bacterium]|jgi:c-di-GMP-binding flagellar brake protein YcgR|nr:flagellar brake protein [Rhodocyclaceae bacterium]
MSVLTDEHLDEFTITFRREILFYLRQLINDGVPVSISFNEGNETFLTMLLDVDEVRNILIFDWGGSEDVNTRFLKSEKNYFIARPQGIRNQFITGQAKEVTHRKRRAFAVKLPDKYVRLQRREFFRLSLPMSQRPPCTLRGPNDQTMTFETVDIGLGGVALEIPAITFPCDMGAVFPRSRIDLKNFGELQVDIKICYSGQITRGNKQLVRLGCHFENLNHVQENELQRFITHVQREERSKMG